MTEVEQIIRTLELKPHPEGGWYRQTFVDPNEVNGRPRSTAIYYLLAGGKPARWHKVDAFEVWHWHAGDPLLIEVSEDGKTVQQAILGIELMISERPQIIIPGGWWQRATCLRHWTLVGCTVSPGFKFEYFELAPEGWEPG